MDAGEGTDRVKAGNRGSGCELVALARITVEAVGSLDPPCMKVDLPRGR